MDKDFTNNDITHIKNKNLEYITFNILNKYNLKHGCFFKKGGVSEGIYSSLNFRTLGNDAKDNVFKNTQIVQKELNLSNVHKATQAHTDNILILYDSNKNKYEITKLNEEEYDSYITKENIATVITTADCNPIIIYDPVGKVVANVHSGWKGTLKQIYLKTIKVMNEKYNCKYEDIIVCIGPSINKCCFTTEDKEFTKQFTNKWNNEKDYIKYIDNKYHIDLLYLIKQDLIELGVKKNNIVLSNICTVCSSDICFSYRVSKKQNEVDYATMGCFVEI